MSESATYGQKSVFAASQGITEEALEEARGYIGQTLRIEQYCHEAGLDVIRHYAYGIGDDNPLWCDEEYARGGPHGVVVAPPTFLYAVFQPGVAPGLPGVQTLNAGGEWTWNRLPCLGERVRATARLVDIEELHGKRAGRMYLQTGETRYETLDGELLATCLSKHFRVPRRETEGGLQYEPKDERQYTEDELSTIEEAVFSELRRGKDTLYWEDVQVGDELTPVVKGPLDRITMTAYYAGALATSGYKACELRWQNWRRARTQPETMWNNYNISYFSEWVLGSVGHQDSEVARAIGMPGAYDNGPMRVGWMAHLVTNWMSDAGFLRRLNVRIRRPNLYGSTTWCRGGVVETSSLSDEMGSIELELVAETMDGELNTEGSATVHLPRRNAATQAGR